MSDYVRGSFLDSAPILPVSARTGEGMPELKDTLVRMAGMRHPKISAAIFGFRSIVLLP